MKSNDPRLNDADIYIRESIRMLEAAQITHRLDHSDGATVGAALECLDIIQRSIGGPHRYDHSRISARLQQVANAIKSCAARNVVSAYADIETAAEIFHAIAAHVDVS